MRLALLAGLICTLFLAACVYNNEEELFPPEPCITENMSYINDIVPIFEQHCLQCHNENSWQILGGNVRMSRYSDITFLIDRNFLLEVIVHEPGLPPMPKDGDKIPDCQIQKITSWINDGNPNN